MQGTENQPWDKKYLEGQKISQGTKYHAGGKKYPEGQKIS